jgi:DNA-binding IclR family transcriptional regulator
MRDAMVKSALYLSRAIMRTLTTSSVPALDRALTVLELLAKSNKGLGLGDLSRSLGVPRSSTHCLLVTLERRGYLERNVQTHRYLFGVKLLGLANLALSGIKLREVAAPFLQSLMRATRLTVHLGILEDGEAVLIEKVEPPGLLRLATWIGKRMDVHCTGLGKALIAYIPEEELDSLIRKHGLPRHNENTVTSVRKFKMQLAEIRSKGYAVDAEEDEIGLCCVGAPVFDHVGQVVASVSAAGTLSQVTQDTLHSLAEKVKKTASAISREMRAGVDGRKPT